MAGHLFVASHGDFGPVSGATTPAGHAVVRVDPESGATEAFLQNPRPNEPTGAPARPVGLAFAPDGSLYVADLGIIQTSPAGLLPRPGTGAIWRIVPSRAAGTPGAGEATPPVAPPAAGEAAAVDIVDFSYDPDPVEVPVGGTVTWTNRDAAPHTATAEDREALQSGTIDQGDSYSETFEEAGTFEYFYEFHANMKGTIVVR